MPQLLHSSPLARPKPKLPPGGGASPDYSAGQLPKPVKEIVADRTATTSTWRDADGTLSVRRYLAPHFYRDGSAGWQPINTSLAAVRGRSGWWESTANNWLAEFGPAGAAEGAEQLTIAGARIGFEPLGVTHTSQTPGISGSTATYDGLWPGIDLQEQVTSAEVKEGIVITQPGTAASFSFRVTGATVRADAAGGADVLVGGHVVGVIPPLTVTVRSASSTARPGGRAAIPAGTTKASGARLSVAGDMVRVSVSQRWLAGLPRSAFPVVIDPTYSGTAAASQMDSVGSLGDVIQGTAQVGYSSGENWDAAVYIPAPSLPAAEPGARPWQLSTAGFSAAGTSGSALYGVGLYGMPQAASTIPTYSQIPYGDAVYVIPYNVEDAWSPSVVVGTGFNEPVPLNTYLATQTAGWWFGITAYNVTTPGGQSVSVFDPSNTYMTFLYVEQPPPTTLTSPAAGSVVQTPTPTLTSTAAVNESSAAYDFKISTSADGTGTLVDSGWLDNQTSWTVPPGSLHDGETYYATVQDAVTSSDPWDTTDPGYVPPALPKPPVAFQVKEYLGDGGASPTDTIGSPPSGTTTPSQGAPSPGASTASETVNMVTGNLSLAVSTHSVQALGGSAGITLAYNSISSSTNTGVGYGLTGQYFADGGSHQFTSSAVGQRTDPTINGSWATGDPPIAGLGQGAPFLVRWTGVLSLPGGNWQIGGLTNGGMRVYLNNASTPTYDDWTGTAGAAAPSFGTANLTGGTQYQIEVDAWDTDASGTAQIQLWVKNVWITGHSQPSTFLVPSNWLTPAATGLPPGWSMIEDPAAAQWVHADNEGNQVILQSASGETATFTSLGGGSYQAPAGDQDYLTFDGNGHLQVTGSDGYLYTFNPDGTLASMTTIADDLHPTALQYTYTGTLPLLSTITDPVSGRSVTLSYGGNPACPTSNPAPTGMLCQVSYWDGTTTTFGYNGQGQLASVTDPGGATSEFGYDSDGRIAEIQDALATDYLAAGGTAGTASSCPSGTTGLPVAAADTQVCYDSSGRVATVVQPAPTPGAPRPARTYTYATGHTDLSIAGFTPSSGYAERDAYDANGRVTQKTDSAGHTSTIVWAPAPSFNDQQCTACNADLPIVTADASGEQTSTVYDQYGNATDTYGPAPLACFSGGWPAWAHPVAPVQGYLPVANPQGTTGCGIATIPHAHNTYDQGINALAATYWANGQYAGTPALQATGTGTGASNGTSTGFCTATSGICAQWPAGSPPVSSDASGHWTLRLTGTIDLPDTGGYNFNLATSQPASVSIDGYPILSVSQSEYPGWTPGTRIIVGTPGCGEALGYQSGPHKIEVDFQGSATQLNELDLSYTDCANWGVQGDVPLSMLDPAYNLKTSSTDPDGNTTTTSYSNATIGPEYGLPTSTTVGAGSSTPLTTTMTYEAPGAGSFLREKASTLPAGNTTSYAYYTGTGGPVAAACGVSSTTPQGGQLEQETDPDPGGGQGRVWQYVYDASGTQVGERTGTPGDIATAPWQCTSYDARGRISQQTWPAANGSAARTVTYNYAVGGNSLASSISDASGTITSTVDLLGRAISYTDVWGQASTTSYNQAGQDTATSGLGASVQLGYDPNTGQPTTTTVNGTLLATASYDTAGRLSGVAYGNGTNATIGYDASGMPSAQSYHLPGGNLLAQDTVTRTAAGRESTETTSQSGGLLGISYAYDGAGRLTQAADTSGGTLVSTYSYAASPGCASPNAGANTNRTSVTIGTTTTSYCYNNADQLISTTSGGVTSTNYAYNERGDQTSDNGTSYTWDSADRAATATTGTTTVTSTYDAVDRLVQSASSAGTTVRYAYAGYTDAPAAVLNASGAILQRLIGLPGGVTVILQSSGNSWAYTNMQGDVTTTANDAGGVTAGPVTYDPWGNLNPGQASPATTAGPNALGAYAATGKLTSTAAGTILLGARTFNPTEARFLSVDPVSGGCANPYTYAFGDPLNHPDLTGQDVCIAMTAQDAISLGEALVAGGSDSTARKILEFFGVPGELIDLILKHAKAVGKLLIREGRAALRMARRSGSPARKENGAVVLAFGVKRVLGIFPTVRIYAIPATYIPGIEGNGKVDPSTLGGQNTTVIANACSFWIGLFAMAGTKLRRLTAMCAPYNEGYGHFHAAAWVH